MSREGAMAIASGAKPLTSGLVPASTQVDGKDQSTLSEHTTEQSTQSPPDELVSSRIAQIARKEAKYREEQESLKREREELTKSKSEFDPFFAKYKEFEAMRAKDPVAAIKMLGFSDTDYINFVAAQEDKSTPEEKAAKVADAKIAEFRKEQETKAQQEEERRNQESIAQFQKNIGITLKTNAEQFELCNYHGEAAEALIYKTIQEAYQEDIKTNPDAEPLTPEKAAELVEGYYEEFHQNANKLKKFQPKEEEVPVVAKKEEPLKAQVSPGMPPRTLTNRVTPTAAAATTKKVETRSEKRERLMRALAAGVKP